MSTVHVKDEVPGAVYVGRRANRAGLLESIWHNPYVIGEALSRAESLKLYEEMLNFPRMRMKWHLLPSLRNKPLACWCRHAGEALTEENSCHADILRRMLVLHTDADLRIEACTARANLILTSVRTLEVPGLTVASHAIADHHCLSFGVNGPLEQVLVEDNPATGEVSIFGAIVKTPRGVSIMRGVLDAIEVIGGNDRE